MRPRVLLVASEAIPLVKTGGLADVIGAMAFALFKRNVDVTLMMPGYPSALAGVDGLTAVAEIGDLPGGPARLLQGCIAGSGVPVLLLEMDGFRRRIDNPYVDADGCEYHDNAQCFASLAHAAVRICGGATPLAPPHIVHANDWHAALMPALLRLAGVTGVGTVLTIHNLAFQGLYPLELAPSLGIPASMLGTDGVEFWGKLNFLKAGIRYADRISIVSKAYAREVLTPRFGCGLDGALRSREQAIVAIPNGVDTETWNPSDDPLIAQPFSSHDLRNKAACKRDLLNLFKLPTALPGPLLALGSRITHQKMADVALSALPQMLDQHVRLQALVLGCGDRSYENGFLALAARFPGRVGVHIGYDERRAHALHAGADMLLHGTRFEPFGLTPIYAMRYGTIPIASRVGGLVDSIVDAGAAGALNDGANGILFDGETDVDMCAAIDRAMALFAHGGDWLALQRNAMSGAFAWTVPARNYIGMYRQIAAPAARDAFAHALADEEDGQAPVAAAVA